MQTVDPPSQDGVLRQLLVRFLEENAKLNLSALRTEDACWTGNILDSIAALGIIATLHPVPGTLMDVGTGGGFPLLPLALLLPEWKCIGLDAVNKKVEAIGRIVKDLKIQNVTLHRDRAEPAGQDKTLREHSDIVTARAVAPIRELLEYTAPFAKGGGHVLLWKSVHIQDELAESEHAQHELRCSLQSAHRYVLPGDFGERQILVFEKTAPLPRIYPRAVGMVKKLPL